MPARAQTTLRGASAAVPVLSAATAVAVAFFSAVAEEMAAAVEETAIFADVALSTPATAPSGATWTTRSPPSTGRPAYVRS